MKYKKKDNKKKFNPLLLAVAVLAVILAALLIFIVLKGGEEAPSGSETETTSGQTASTDGTTTATEGTAVSTEGTTAPTTEGTVSTEGTAAPTEGSAPTTVPTEASKPIEVTTATGAATQPTIPETVPLPTEPEFVFSGEMISIETPYCTVYYPVEWEDYLEHKGQTKDGIYTHSFYCKMNGKRYELFDIYFNSEDLGDYIGYITANGEKVRFSVAGTDFTPDASWSEDDLFIYYGMADSINDVIQSVVNSPGFSEE